MPFYKVKGKYTETNRQRTVRISVATENDIETEMVKTGFQPPFNYELDSDQTDYNAPTDSQLSYARDLGITIPLGITKDDLSTLIDRAVNNDNKEPNSELVQFAFDRGFEFSKYIGKKALYSLIHYNLTGIDKIAFFIFCVYRNGTDDRRGNLDTHPEKDFIYSLANELSSDESVVKSIDRYNGSDLRYFGTLTFVSPNGVERTVSQGGSTNTIAYKAVCSRLEKRYNIKISPTKKIYEKASNTPPPATNINTPPPTYTPKQKATPKKILGIVVIVLSFLVTSLTYDTFLLSFAWLFNGIGIGAVWFLCSDIKTSIKVVITVALSMLAIASIMFGIAKISNPDLTFDEFADTLSSESSSSYSYYSSSKY